MKRAISFLLLIFMTVNIYALNPSSRLSDYEEYFPDKVLFIDIPEIKVNNKDIKQFFLDFLKSNDFEMYLLMNNKIDVKDIDAYYIDGINYKDNDCLKLTVLLKNQKSFNLKMKFEMHWSYDLDFFNDNFDDNKAYFMHDSHVFLAPYSANEEDLDLFDTRLALFFNNIEIINGQMYGKSFLDYEVYAGFQMAEDSYSILKTLDRIQNKQNRTIIKLYNDDPKKTLPIALIEKIYKQKNFKFVYFWNRKTMNRTLENSVLFKIVKFRGMSYNYQKRFIDRLYKLIKTYNTVIQSKIIDNLLLFFKWEGMKEILYFSDELNFIAKNSCLVMAV